MTIDRRSLIKGIAACGIAAPILAALPTLAQAGMRAPTPDRTLRVMVGAGAAASPFVRGVRTVAPARALDVREAGLAIGFLLGFEQELHSGPPTRVIGLLDDALATPLLDLARSAGARVAWLGQHVADAGRMSHRLVTSPRTEACALAFGHYLEACGAAFTLDHERPYRAAASVRSGAIARADGHADRWATVIGALLASPAAPALDEALRIRTADVPLRGSFVSFSIET